MIWAVREQELMNNGFVIDAVHLQWRSTQDDATRKVNNKYEEHQRQVKKNESLKRVSKSCVLFEPSSITILME